MPTKIEWTDETWNPVTGCTKVSAGCKNCYAERIAKRFWGERKFTDVQCHPERLSQPQHWRKPRMVFVNSMSDLFHEDIPPEFVGRVLNVIGSNSRHIFQILTKRPYYAKRFINTYYSILVPDPPLPNLWLGVTCENQDTADERIYHLLDIKAKVHFISIEPMLERIELPEDLMLLMDWVIVGAETGPGARYMNPDWAREIRDVCQKSGIPFFIKKMSNNQPIPDDLMIREYPA